jgi:elongation factor 1 alpha-like protein
MPSGEIASIKAIEQEGKPLTVAMAGDGVDIGLTGVEAGMLSPGGVLCHPDFPIPVASRFQVRVLTLGITIPILPGSQVCCLWISSPVSWHLTRMHRYRR